MKKNQLKYRVAMAFAASAAFACSIAWVRPAPAPKEGKGAPTTQPAASVSDEAQLIQQLQSDGLINQVQGFVVEKRQNVLFIDGTQVPDNVARKYTTSLKQGEIRVQIYPLEQRMRMHPDADLLQVLLPVSMSSPCVDNKPKGPGC